MSPGTAQLKMTPVGSGSQPMVMLHGLFGQGRNFAGVAKDVTGRADVTCWLVDLPNHGGSAWTSELNLGRFAELIHQELTANRITNPIVVGHSLGGRVAMRLALEHPAQIRALAVVDIAPGPDAYAGDQQPLIQALLRLDLSSLDSRSDADRALSADIPDARVRGFLLQNLRPTAEGGWQWQINLDLLANQVERIRDWPADERVFRGPVVWITGADSPYVSGADEDLMRAHFPLVQQVRLKEAGHWVHADQPRAFADTLVWFTHRLNPDSPQ